MADENGKTVEEWGEELQALVNQKKWEELEAGIYEFDKLYPENANTYFLRGLLNHQRKNFIEASKNFEKSTRINPKYQLAFYYCGDTQYKLEQPQNAIHNFDRAIELKQDDYLSYYGRAMAKVQMNRYEDAITDFDIVIKHEPKNAKALFNRGISKTYLKLFEDSIEDFTRAIELEFEIDQSLFNRAGAHRNLGHYEKAIIDYTEAIKQNPDDYSYFNNRGETYNKMQLYEEAITDLNQALELNSKNYGIYVNLANAQVGLKKFDEAIKNYDIASEFNHDDMQIYHNRAVAVAQKIALKTQEEFIDTYRDNISYITNSQEIIDLYKHQIRFSYLRLYGNDSDEVRYWDEVLSNNSNDKNKIVNNGVDRAKKQTVCDKFCIRNKKHLNVDAAKTSGKLCWWVMGVVVLVTWMFYCLYKGVLSEIGFHHIFQYTSVIAILSTPFFLHARYITRRFEDERTIAHSLTRDMVSLLFWNAQEPENKATNRSKLAPAVFEQIATNSTADVSLRMMGRRRSGADEARGDDGRLSFMESTLQDIKSQLDVIKGRQKGGD